MDIPQDVKIYPKNPPETPQELVNKFQQAITLDKIAETRAKAEVKTLETEAEVVKRGRGRPKGSKNKPKEFAVKGVIPTENVPADAGRTPASDLHLIDRADPETGHYVPSKSQWFNSRENDISTLTELVNQLKSDNEELKGKVAQLAELRPNSIVFL